MKKTILLTAVAGLLSGLPSAWAQEGLPAAARLAARVRNPLAAVRRPTNDIYRRVQTLEQNFPGGTTATIRRQTYSNFTPRHNPQLTQHDSLDGTSVLPLRQDRRRYNSREQITTDTTVTWTSLQRYVPTQVITYTYNAQDSLAQEVGQVEEMGALVPSYRETHTYDAASRRRTRIQYETYSQDTWGDYGRDDYAYNAQGQLTQIEFWITVAGGPFEIGARLLFAYNAQGRVQSYTSQLVNANGAFDNLGQTVLVYNGAGRVEAYQTSTWTNGAWQPFRQYLLTYDDEGNEATGTVQDYINGAFRNVERYLHSYQRVLTTGTARLRAGLAVVPNPTAGPAEVCFALPAPGAATVEVLDGLGRVVSALPVAPGLAAQRVSLAGLNLRAGLYVVRLSAAGQSQQVKLVVQ